MLDYENPDLVVFTGDQVTGNNIDKKYVSGWDGGGGLSCDGDGDGGIRF